MIVLDVYAFAAAADAATSEKPEAAEAEFKNRVSIKGAYKAAFRTTQSAGLDLESLGGFALSYERIFRPWLTLELTKPFHFGPQQFDSPFEALLEVSSGWEGVELFLGAGVTFDIRIIEREFTQEGGRRPDLEVGVLAGTGCVVELSARWSLEAEVSYAYFPVSEEVRHELVPMMGPLLAF